MKKCEKIRRMFFALLVVVCVVNCMASAASAKTYFVVSPRACLKNIGISSF